MWINMIISDEIEKSGNNKSTKAKSRMASFIPPATSQPYKLRLYRASAHIQFP
jgi:hypothetical protein